MKKPVLLFKGATGVNNKVDPSRISETDLANAFNVDIDDSGRVSRAKAFITTGCALNIHSWYSNGERGVFVSGNNLYLVLPDLTYVLIATGLPTGVKTRFATVNSAIYFVNQIMNGKIENDAAGPWVGQAYVGPTTFRKFSDPPVGHLIAYHAGRIWIASDKVLLWSEPFAFSWFDRARNYLPFSSRLRMLVAVDDGMYLSTEQGVYFVQGTNPKELTQNKVHDFPVVEGTDLNAPGGQILGGESTNQVALWTSTRSVCVGYAGGRVAELTEKKVTYPDGSSGSAAFLNNTYYALINE